MANTRKPKGDDPINENPQVETPSGTNEPDINQGSGHIDPAPTTPNAQTIFDAVAMAKEAETYFPQAILTFMLSHLTFKPDKEKGFADYFNKLRASVTLLASYAGVPGETLKVRTSDGVITDFDTYVNSELGEFSCFLPPHTITLNGLNDYMREKNLRKGNLVAVASVPYRTGELKANTNRVINCFNGTWFNVGRYNGTKKLCELVIAEKGQCGSAIDNPSSVWPVTVSMTLKASDVYDLTMYSDSLNTLQAQFLSVWIKDSFKKPNS